MKKRVFLFGEAEKGEFCSPIVLHSIHSVMHQLGNPPSESVGIDYAIQTVLSQKELIFFRVREEGFSVKDYFEGVKLLYNSGEKLGLSAVCLPGVGDHLILDAVTPICKRIKSMLVLSEKDLYDYLTHS